MGRCFAVHSVCTHGTLVFWSFSLCKPEVREGEGPVGYGEDRVCTLHGPRRGRGRIFRLSPSKSSLWTLLSVQARGLVFVSFPPLGPRCVGGVGRGLVPRLGWQ
jgi:hypothetical protein